MKRDGSNFKDSDSINPHVIICIVDNQPEIDGIKASAACALLISVLRILVCNILAIEHSQCKLYLVYYMAESAGCGSMEDFSTWLRKQGFSQNVVDVFEGLQKTVYIFYLLAIC